MWVMWKRPKVIFNELNPEFLEPGGTGCFSCLHLICAHPLSGILTSVMQICDSTSVVSSMWMAHNGSYSLMFGSQLVNCLGRSRKWGFDGSMSCGWALRFEKLTPDQILLFKFSVTVSTPCLSPCSLPWW